MNKKEVKKYLGQMNAFAGVSRNSVNTEVLERFPEEKNRCFVIYNGINLNKFGGKWQNLEGSLAIRDRFGLDPNDIVLIFVGRLRKAKGVHTLIKAAKKVIQRYNNVKLVIVGGHFFGGEQKTTRFMKELYREADPIKKNILFTGFISRDKIQEMYRMADILVVPSHMEAFGVVYAEAGASGLPVIGTVRGAIPEVVEEGVTGLLIDDPEDEDALAEKILYFVEKPEEMRAFGERGRKRIEENFTWELAAKRTEEMYDKVLRQGG
jgi:spore coat protein SA